MLLDSYVKDKPVVVYDAREEKSFVVEHLKKFDGIVVVKKSLEIADYLVQTKEGTIAVERKRASDFMKSISDGRLFNQLEHLRDYNDARLILEGAVLTDTKHSKCYCIDDIEDVVNRVNSGYGTALSPKEFFVHPHAFTSIFKKIQDTGIKVIITGGPYDTADTLKYWATRGSRKESLTIRQKKKTFSDIDKQLFLVSGLTGISTKRAKALLEKFGTPIRIFNAFLEYPSKRFPVEGIGEKTVVEIKRLLTGKLVGGEHGTMLEHEFKEWVRELENLLDKKEIELNKMRANELKSLLKERGLRTSGSKQELIERLLEDMPEEEKIDIAQFIKKYEELMRSKSRYQRIPERVEMTYKKFK